MFEIFLRRRASPLPSALIHRPPLLPVGQDPRRFRLRGGEAGTPYRDIAAAEVLWNSSRICSF